MKSLDEWFNLALGSVRTTSEKAKEIAVMCYFNEQSGGQSGTWHASSIVHSNNKCNCYNCYRFTPLS